MKCKIHYHPLAPFNNHWYNTWKRIALCCEKPNLSALPDCFAGARSTSAKVMGPGLSGVVSIDVQAAIALG